MRASPVWMKPAGFFGLGAEIELAADFDQHQLVALEAHAEVQCGGRSAGAPARRPPADARPSAGAAVDVISVRATVAWRNLLGATGYGAGDGHAEVRVAVDCRDRSCRRRGCGRGFSGDGAAGWPCARDQRAAPWRGGCERSSVEAGQAFALERRKAIDRDRPAGLVEKSSARCARIAASSPPNVARAKAPVTAFACPAMKFVAIGGGGLIGLLRVVRA